MALSQTAQWPIPPRAPVGHLGAAGCHVRRSVREIERQPAADDQHRGTQILRSREHFLATGQSVIRAWLFAIPDGHRGVYGRFWEVMVRLDLSADRNDGNGLSQD